MNDLQSKIESLLFIAQRPLSTKKISGFLQVTEKNVLEALSILQVEYQKDRRGIVLVSHQDHYELVSSPAHASLVRDYTKEEFVGDLTRAGLETVTVISYRGPVTKVEIEQIRGVNCTVVLRNLLLRGYIESSDGGESEKTYTVSIDFIRHLGIQKITELPDYQTLNAHEFLDSLIDASTQKQ